MLLATAADRIFGIGGPGRLTAREAFAVATNSKVATLTAKGFEVRPEYLEAVWSLARLERSVTPVGVVGHGEGEETPVFDGPDLPVNDPPVVATRQLGLFQRIGC